MESCKSQEKKKLNHNATRKRPKHLPPKPKKKKRGSDESTSVEEATSYLKRKNRPDELN